MSYDEHLALRIRGQLAGSVPFTEKKMFGGLAFLIGGNMSVSASGNGGMMLRCLPADTDELCRAEGVDRVVMRGKTMDGWIRVDDEAITTDEALAHWVRVGVDFASSLPAK